jgi:acetyl-CoA C-acetyltransferase
MRSRYCSYARTAGKSGRGGFNITPPMSMAAHAINTPRARRRRHEYVELLSR